MNELTTENNTNVLSHQSDEVTSSVKNTIAEKTMTTKEVAEALGVSERSILNIADSKGYEKFFTPLQTKGGIQNKRVFTESQVTAIKLELQNHAKVNALSPKTYLEKQLLIQQAMQLQAEMIAELQAENERKEKQLIEQKPKVDFYDRVTESPDCIDIGQCAKILNVHGIGRNKLFEILRQKKILNEHNQPYQKYVDCGYFRIIETSFNLPDGTQKINLKTVVFQKGLDFIRKMIEVAK